MNLEKMGERTDLKCQCGGILYRYGFYLRCDACSNLFLCQENGALEKFTNHFYKPIGTYEQFISKIFTPILPDVVPDLFDEMKILLKNEVYIPYINVIAHGKDMLLPIVKVDEESTNIIDADIPDIDNYLYFKQLPSSDTNDVISGKWQVVDYDLGKLEEAKESYEYVSSEMYFIPIRTFKFKYKGKIFFYFYYGEQVMLVSKTLQDELTLLSKSIKGNRFPVYNIRKYVFFVIWILMVVCAWVVFCYSFQKLHSFWELFYWADGYKCLFRFLGVSIVAAIGCGMLSQSFDYVIKRLYEMRIQTDKKRYVNLMKTKAFSVLNVKL